MPQSNLTSLNLPESVADILGNTRAARDAFTLLEHFRTMRIELTSANDTRGTASLFDSGQNMIMPVPFRFAGPIADTTADATVLSEALNALLADLARAGMAPVYVATELTNFWEAHPHTPDGFGNY